MVMSTLEPAPRPLAAVWPPKNAVRPPPPSFFTRIPEADKVVEWPPKNEHEQDTTPKQFSYPSQTVALKDVLPVHQPEIPVFSTQPTTSAREPIRGELRWPPEESRMENEQSPGRIPTPRLRRKDYSDPVCAGFFSQHHVPSNYCGYRVAPGTLHISPEAGRYITSTGATDF